MLPFLLILIITAIIFIPLCFTYSGRTTIGKSRIKFITKQLTKRHKGKAILSVYLPVVITGKQPLYDGVLVCTSGIYIIKIMNIKGELSGVKEQQEWTLFNKKTKINKPCENPLINDEARIKEVGKLLGITDNIYSCVVYIQGNIKSVNAPILTIRKFYKFLKANRKKKVISKEDVVKYAKIIEDYRSKQLNRIANNKCIKCGQHLELINKPKKYIINCTNPKCKLKYKIKK